jgi:hypothetical protein
LPTRELLRVIDRRARHPFQDGKRDGGLSDATEVIAKEAVELLSERCAMSLLPAKRRISDSLSIQS